MCRAVYGRIENTLQGLPPPYKLNRPLLCLVTSSEERIAAKTPNFSINWAHGMDTVEVINSTTGRPEVNGPDGQGISRLCKHILAKRFVNLVGKLPSITGIEKKLPVEYCDVKAAVQSYTVCY